MICVYLVDKEENYTKNMEIVIVKKNFLLEYKEMENSLKKSED